MSKTSASIIRRHVCSRLLIGLCFLVAAFPATAQFGSISSGMQSMSASSPNDSEERAPERPKRAPGEPKYHYALWNGLMIGADLFSPATRLLGADYGGFEISAELNLLNRFFPIWEIGIGSARSTPEDLNFTYTGKTALYNRIGMNYNFKYNSESPNFFHIGFRYGFSVFRYDITNITLQDPYWQESAEAEILNQRSYAHWLSLVAGIRVNVARNFYMGWNVQFQFMLSQKTNYNSNAWYIPGFGSDGNVLGFSYSLYYRIPMQKKVYTPPVPQKKR